MTTLDAHSPTMGDQTRHQRLSHHRLYWAVLDASSVDRGQGGRAREQLGYLFEDLLPVPIEQVHAVYLPLGGKRVLACGANPDLLRRALDEGAVTLAPDALPTFVAASDPAAGGTDAGTGASVDPAHLNLLVGAFEPLEVRGARRRWIAQMVLALVLVTACIGVGLWRRAAAADRAAGAHMERGRSLVQSVLPESSRAAHPELALLAELRQLQQTRVDPTAVTQPESAAVVLGAVMGHWPREVQARPESASVGDNAVTLRGMAGSSDDAQRVADAYRQVAGWTLEQPQFRTETTGVSFTVSLRPDRADRASATTGGGSR